MPAKYAKYAIDPTASDVHGRFAALYGASKKGKQQLLSQCVAGGLVLKECGLSELILSICESATYTTATTPSQRRALLLSELLSASTGAPSAATTHAVTPPMAEVEPVATQAAAAIVADNVEPPAPAAEKPKLNVPNFGSGI
ncbi:MAG: hypothetical protein ACRC8Q_05975 [Aeromonas sp.]